MALLGACGTLGSARMPSPDAFGMDEVNATLYVDPAMGAEKRQDLQRQIGIGTGTGRAQVEHTYGDITTAPCFVACVTAECALRSGSYG